MLMRMSHEEEKHALFDMPNSLSKNGSPLLASVSGICIFWNACASRMIL